MPLPALATSNLGFQGEGDFFGIVWSMLKSRAVLVLENWFVAPVLWSSWLRRLPLRGFSYGGGETVVRIPQGHILHKPVGHCHPPGGGGEGGVEKCDRRESNLGSLGPPTALPSVVPLHYSHLFFLHFWVGASLHFFPASLSFSPGRHHSTADADAGRVGGVGRKCSGRNFIDVGRCQSSHPDSIGE